MRSKKVLIIGGATRDIFIEYQNPQAIMLGDTDKKPYMVFEEGTKIDVHKIVLATGGGATNAAVSFKRLGCDVSIVCKIGKDEAGDAVLAELQKEGVSIEHMVRAPGDLTGTSFIMPSAHKDRTVLAYRGINTQLTAHDVPEELMAQHSHVYITSLSGAAARALLPIVRLAKKHNMYVATNPGTSQLAAGADILAESLPYIDTLIMNAHEAKVFMLSLVQTCAPLRQKIAQKKHTVENSELPQLLRAPITYKDICFDIRYFFQELLNRGPQVIVVTNGAEGVYVATQEGIYFHRSLPTKLVSTIGAGDAFGSCFVTSLAQDKTIEQAMERGIMNSGSVLNFVDAKSGLLTAQELEKRVTEAPQNIVQKFTWKI